MTGATSHLSTENGIDSISPCSASFVLVFHFHGRTRLSGIRAMPSSPSLNARLLVGTQHKFVLFESSTVPNPVIEVQNPASFCSKIGISRENPAAMLPRFNRILMKPAPHGATADGSYQARLPDMIDNIFSAPARKGNSIFSRQLTGDGFTLTLHKICSFYFGFFMLPSEAHQGSAADLVEPHDLHSLSG
jgi:hypothetical protein